ncbi:MAG: hypothetical protein RIB98_01745 [Acidimicrobiales bacterium]
MKRIFWSGVGYAAGLSSSIYVQRRVRRAVEHYTPEQVRHDVSIKGRQVAEKAREVVIDLRDAAVEGAEAMRDRENELRREFAPEPPRRGNPHQHRPSRLRR